MIASRITMAAIVYVKLCAREHELQVVYRTTYPVDADAHEFITGVPPRNPMLISREMQTCEAWLAGCRRAHRAYARLVRRVNLRSDE